MVRVAFLHEQENTRLDGRSMISDRSFWPIATFVLWKQQRHVSGAASAKGHLIHPYIVVTTCHLRCAAATVRALGPSFRSGYTRPASSIRRTTSAIATANTPMAKPVSMLTLTSTPTTLATSSDMN